MPEIIIAVRDKLPMIVGERRGIVADNTDYTIRFDFDDQWEEGEKTIYFVRSNGYVYAPMKMVGDTIEIPNQQNVGLISRLMVGVQQGETETSRPCAILVYPSVVDVIDDEAVQPDESLWQNILKRLEYLEKYGGGSGGISFEIGYGLVLADGYKLSAELGNDSFTEISNTKVQEIFNKVMEG